MYFSVGCVALRCISMGGVRGLRSFLSSLWGTLDGEEIEGGEGEGRGEGKMGIDIEVPDEEYWTRFRAGWVGPPEGCRQFEVFA